ncbi:molybdenum cofactor biosynthesis protein MoaE [Candidatus Methylospira mobilis]|uniref:Molybdopterin synthase catalytic subunit n=1 Tax=Candidatus Methylospira mobilis TaxID=1808979 RepID=A0A5Q0BPX6_9GAMM|nr:molybdenum cofactor biosynthesis protein MoaE [Candidatus Methylospira mobilis]QFY44351.1 molybdenum cofactor biosynthesis protein MoaE [Candidatus Methylospira mobilis]WNV06218.1 molybdenum cofactor biosynthesis protein MoaE [Candidatus Methylospira mobilis]
MAVRISAMPFEPLLELAAAQSGIPELKGKAGASAIFIGAMRDFNDNDDVQAMTLEHYPGMTERQIETIIDETRRQWPIIDALVIHRVGYVLPGDALVLVAVWSAHRSVAFDACRHILEALKSSAPFWKKEVLANDSERWVEHNTPF